MEVFEQSIGAVSLAALLEELQGKMNKTTVYRILQRLEEYGMLHSFRGKDGGKWYAKCKDFVDEKLVDTHPHFQCESCGKVECLPIDIAIPLLPNYQIDSAELLLVGRCKDCLS
ncbi:MAG: transcriptional repressor [Bacteroidota bacterium]